MIQAKYLETFIKNSTIRIIKTIWGKNNVETSQYLTPFGVEGVPQKDTIAIVAETQNREDPVIIGYISQSASALIGPGEVEIYSEDSDGIRKAKISMRNNGTCEILGTGDFMVRYSKLEEAYNELKESHNKLVDAFNQHVHPTNGSIPTPIPGLIPATESEGDITGAKIDRVNTIG